MVGDGWKFVDDRFVHSCSIVGDDVHVDLLLLRTFGVAVQSLALIVCVAAA